MGPVRYTLYALLLVTMFQRILEPEVVMKIPEGGQLFGRTIGLEV